MAAINIINDLDMASFMMREFNGNKLLKTFMYKMNEKRNGCICSVDGTKKILLKSSKRGYTKEFPINYDQQYVESNQII